LKACRLHNRASQLLDRTLRLHAAKSNAFSPVSSSCDITLPVSRSHSSDCAAFSPKLNPFVPFPLLATPEKRNDQRSQVAFSMVVLAS
jgi:hypothetical protein